MKHIREYNQHKQSLKDKLEILKKYIKVIEDNGNDDDWLPIKYFIILHNFLKIEKRFLQDVIDAKKEINSKLHLEDTNSYHKIIDTFQKLYDNNNSHIRFATETFDSIESIRIYLKEHPEVFQKLL